MIWQILVASAAIQCVAAAIAVATIAYAVKKTTIAEMTDAMAAAEQVVRQEIDRVSRAAAPDTPIEQTPFNFGALSGVDIELYDADGKRVNSRSADDAPNTDEQPNAPRWFAALVGPSDSRLLLPVEVGGKRIGSVVLVAQASEEIDEVWDDFTEFAVLAIAINLLVFLLIFWAVSRIMSPLGLLVEGLHDLELGHYNVRLPRPDVFELAAITDRFNALSGQLGNARSENLALSQRLISIQDDERRQIAAELHDELGPLLFGLSADLSSLRQNSGGRAKNAGPVAGERIERLLGMVNRIRDLNRQLLGKLRPMSIGRVSLGEAISGLLAELESFKGKMAIAFTGAELAGSYGDTVDLTVYRCIREGVTNAIRHAGGKRVGVTVREHANSAGEPGSRSRSLGIVIEDDGRGISPQDKLGYGLTGIRERVRALGGKLTIARGQSGGTRLEISIPLDAQSSP